MVQKEDNKFDEVAVGTKLFSRTKRFHDLLKSVPTGVSTVYVAHDGKWNSEKRDVLTNDYAFDLEILDLEYDAGVGVGKNSIVDACESEFLLMLDTDQRVTSEMGVLLRQLKQCTEIGGISGNIAEPDRGRLWQSAKNFDEASGGLVRNSDGNQQMEIVADSPLVRFDFIPSAVLFRMSCLDDYRWDSEYTVGSEHLDFHVGHWKQTDWSFAVNPTVSFEHYPGGNAQYLTRRHGENVDEGRKYFLEKWDYDFVRDKRAYWFDTETPSPRTALRRAVSRHLPGMIYKYGKRAYDSALTLLYRKQ